MIKVAIVGNIASGKSTAEKILEDNGYKVYDTDKIAHKILALNEDVKEIFGTNNRQEISKIVFSNQEKLKKLETIIHPLVKNELEKIFREEDCGMIFVSVPQLFETGFNTMFDRIIYITADENLRKKRLIERNSFTSEEAQKRINAQIEGDKKEKSDFVIENNSSIEELKNQLLNILKNLS